MQLSYLFSCSFQSRRVSSKLLRFVLVALLVWITMSGRSSNSNEDSAGRAKKKGGGFLARQSKAKKTITEEELLKKDAVTPDDVLKLTKCTESK